MSADRAGWRRWRRAGPGLVALVALAAALAPWLAPYDPDEQLDPAAARHRPPGTRLHAVRLDTGWRLADEVERRDGALVFTRLGQRHEVPAGEVLNLTGDGVADSRLFLLGSDRYGRDLLSRLLHGGRVSLRVGLAAVLLALGVGVGWGMAAALSGRLVDQLLMRAVDGLLAFPRLFLVLAMAALWRGSETTVVLVLAATGWMEVARLVRGEALRLADQDVILAARAVGCPPGRIVLRHLLPLMAAPILVHAALRVGDVILVEAALSFLGFGIQPPTASWGNLVADGQDVLVSAWWVAALPGLAIVLTVLGLNLTADDLQRELGPGCPPGR